MTTNMFDDFREQQVVERKSTNRNAAKFIFRGSMSTIINYQGRDYKVGFVYDNREEEDKAYLYVLKPQIFSIGQIFRWTDTNEQDHFYIIYDEEKSVKDVDYNKYLVFECNVQVDDLWAYMSGPRSTYVNTQLRQALYEVSLAKPVLITGADQYQIAEILSIGGRYWRIIEKDNYSAQGIVYYYLEQFVTQKNIDEAVNTFTPDMLEFEQLHPGDEITLNTQDGYFECDYELHATITPDKVMFTVPYDVDQITIAYKTAGLVQEKTYKVVM